MFRIGERTAHLECSLSAEIPADLRHRLLAVAEADLADPDEIGSLDREFGQALAEACLQLLAHARMGPTDVSGIGSHGQTIRHRPPRHGAPGFTWQIGDPNIIAQVTSIDTVADFRRRDVAVGGQGAPLVPAFHDWLFGVSDRRRSVVNIGGMANVTLLPGRSHAVAGFDTGPGNALMDSWTARHLGMPFDHGGEWARSGRVIDGLLATLLEHPFLSMIPPKSTGREEFNVAWLDDVLARREPVAPADVQATLMEFTAVTISQSLRRAMPLCDEILLCGGGAHNSSLAARLGELCAPATVTDTLAAGLDPDWVEAGAFAWLAHRTLQGLPGNLPEVTGARESVSLGGIYPGARGKLFSNRE